MPHLLSKSTLAALALFLAGCSSTPDISVSNPDHAALPTMVRIGKGMNQCWFKSGDKAFAKYRMALEINSYAGRPRVLLVKNHSPETKPLLVVQAEGNPAKLDAFGPLMGDAALSARISADVSRWANSGSGC